MIHAMKHRLAALGVALALLAGCATSRLVTQQANPDYVGKSFKSVMVVAVTSDALVRRTFEDRMVALLGQRGAKGIPAYAALGAIGRRRLHPRPRSASASTATGRRSISRRRPLPARRRRYPRRACSTR